MSGGHYNYKYCELTTLAEDILLELLNPESSLRAKPLAVQVSALSLANSLLKLADQLKELEWLLSGDTGEETYFHSLAEIEGKRYEDVLRVLSLLGPSG